MIWVMGMPAVILIVVAVVALAVIVLVAVRIVRRPSDAPLRLPDRAGPSSPPALICPFCRREYRPAETGGRCPGCGAASPRR